jgi:hypothetical protein
VSLSQQSGDFFFAIRAQTDVFSDREASFQVLIQSGSGASLLMLPEAAQVDGIPGDALSVRVEADNIFVEYGSLYKEAVGQQPLEVQGALYTWYMVPNDQLNVEDVLNTACGVTTAFTDVWKPAQVASSGAGLPGISSIPLPAPGDYTIMVVARCNGVACGDETLSGQSIAYQSAEFSITSGNNGKGKGKPKGPPVGGIVAAVFGSLLAIGVAFLLYRNWESISRFCARKSSGSGYSQTDDSFYSSADVGASSGYDRL